MKSKLAYFTALSWLSAILLTDSADAKCSPHPLSGKWQAMDYTDVSPKSVHIIHNCRTGGSKAENEEPEWIVRVFNSCRPADCIWGRSAAKRNLTGILEANFETFAATRKITIIPAGYKIEVNYTIDYRSESRKDLQGRVIMMRRE